MAETEITCIFREIIENNLLYCAICLRTEQERRLVEPFYYRKCISLLPLRTPDHAALRACVVCETHARRAYGVFSAASFAAVVNRWFEAMAHSLRYLHLMPDYLRRITQHSKFEDLPLSEYWQLLRSRTELLQTEILTVSSDGLENEEDVDRVESVSPPSAPTPNTSPNGATSQTEEFTGNDMLSDPGLERVVIIEDEDEEEAAQAQPVSGALPILPEARPAADTFVLHPAHALPDVTYYVPSLNAVTNNAGLLPAPETYSKCLPPKGAMSENTESPEVDGNSYSTKLDNVYDAQLRCSPVVNVNSSIVNMNNPIVNVNSPFVNVTNPVVNMSVPMIVSSESVMCGGQAKPGSKRILAPVTVRTGDSLSHGKTVVDSKTVKQAVMSSWVDWEDKIPMDVISFMDATDPNAEKLLGSNVEEPDPSRPPKKSRYKPDGDVIDLC